MLWVALIIISILMLIVFFGVTIAGGKAHDRQNLENASRTARSDIPVWDEAPDDRGPRHIRGDRRS